MRKGTMAGRGAGGKATGAAVARRCGRHGEQANGRDNPLESDAANGSSDTGYAATAVHFEGC
jgi:hypothetical protein